MISKNNRHLTVKVSLTVYNYVMKFSKLYNVSASGLCNYIIQHGILELDRKLETEPTFLPYLSKYINHYDLRRK